MNIEKIQQNAHDIAVVSGGEVVISDLQSALDLIMTVKYETGAARIAIEKAMVVPEFFILSSGIAGEILQKFVTYHVKLAIFGDYSKYTSKPLHDFIYESNKGRDIFFVASRDEAIEKLANAE